MAAMDEMGTENRRLQEKCKQQDEVMSRHQQQFDECAFVIDEVKKVRPPSLTPLPHPFPALPSSHFTAIFPARDAWRESTVSQGMQLCHDE